MVQPPFLNGSSKTFFTCDSSRSRYKTRRDQVVPKVNSFYLYDTCNVVKGDLGRAGVSSDEDGVCFLQS